jgi:hypothetical protein
MNSKIETFSNNLYFFLKERENDVALYFSVSNTLNEARKNDEIMLFEKKNLEKVKKEIGKIQKDKKIKDTKGLKSRLKQFKGEIGELVDYDGTFLSSKIPIINPKLAPKGTIDQEIAAAHQTNNPVSRGYRVYWGESVDGEDEVINEIDMDGAFGYEETKDMDGKHTFKYLKDKMGLEPEDAKDRTEKFGKDIRDKKEKKTPKKIKSKEDFIGTFNLFEKRKITEKRNEEARKLIEDILVSKKKSDGDVSKKEAKVSKTLVNNIKSLKKLADKEGIELGELIKMIKKGE